jgi:hypothetical protein
MPATDKEAEKVAQVADATKQEQAKAASDEKARAGAKGVDVRERSAAAEDARFGITPEVAARLAEQAGEVKQVNGYDVARAERELFNHGVLPGNSVYDPYGNSQFVPLPDKEAVRQAQRDLGEIPVEQEEEILGV